jgi:DNA-binding transcriptional regulator YiaG
MSTRQAVKIVRARHLAQSGEGERIRRAALMSAAELGRHVGVSHVTIRRWERGERRPCEEWAVRYVDLIDALARELT